VIFCWTNKHFGPVNAVAVVKAGISYDVVVIFCQTPVRDCSFLSLNPTPSGNFT
jgi:hypothetical protein